MLGSILGAAISGGLSLMGASKQNAAAKQQASNQMAFQERMSSTAYQRSMADMKSAGLNPILAYKTGGASAPSGTAAPIVNELEPAVNSAQGSRRLSAELQNLSETNKNIKEDTALKSSSALLNAATRENKKIEGRILREQLHSAKATAAQAKTDQEFNESTPGKILRVIDKIGTSVNPFTSSAKNVTIMRPSTRR